MACGRARRLWREVFGSPPARGRDWRYPITNRFREDNGG